MKRRRALLALAIMMGVAAAAFACGGDDDDSSLIPQLAGTPLPTVTPVLCGVTSPATLPASFPSDVAVPPVYLIESIETAPFLKVSGRVTIPPDQVGSRPPVELLAAAIGENMPGWTFAPNQSPTGLDFTFTHPDGRSGRYTAENVPRCTLDIFLLSYEIPWVTP